VVSAVDQSDDMKESLLKGAGEGAGEDAQAASGQGHGVSKPLHKLASRGVVNRANLLGLLVLPAAILSLEAIFNLAGIGQGEIVKPDPEIGCRHMSNKSVTWRLEGYCRDRFNSSGMRDVEHPLAKPIGTYRIAFVGDSFTEGLQVDRADIFAEKVGKFLNGSNQQNKNQKKFETINFGCSSYSTGQELLQYEREIRPYKPDLVVVLYTPGDTLENSIVPKKRAETEARPYFYLDHDNQLKEDDSLLVDNAAKLKSTPLKEFLRANSTIFGAYTQMHLSMTMSDKVFFRTTRLIDQTITKVSNLLTDKKKQTVSTKGAPGQTNSSRAGEKDPDQVEISAAVVERFADEVKSDQAKFVLMMYPDVGGGNLVYAQSRDRLAKLAAKEGFGYLDLSQEFKKDVNPNNLFVQVHFSKRGHELTTEMLTAYLKSAGYLN
jgi:lysophospholipase L1-like esterase